MVMNTNFENQPEHYITQTIHALQNIECVRCHAIENKIKTHASDKVK